MEPLILESNYISDSCKVYCVLYANCNYNKKNVCHRGSKQSMQINLKIYPHIYAWGHSF